MTINELSIIAHKNARDKGFWQAFGDIKDIALTNYENKTLDDLMIGHRLMLIVSELGEALEALRHNKTSQGLDLDTVDFKKQVKDTFEDEIADVFIRLGDLVGYLNIDIEKHIKMKMQYNMTRPKLHGKEF